MRQLSGKQTGELSIICDGISRAAEYCRVDNAAFKILKRNLPGAITFLLDASSRMPDKALQRRKTIGVRMLGIADLLQKYPYEVSGGQKQRAAVARALITSPQILLADEPTGALDSRASDSLLSLFGEINRAGQTILMVTHSTKAASHAGRVLFIKDGVVFHQIYRGGSTNEEMFHRISDTLTAMAAGA